MKGRATLLGLHADFRAGAHNHPLQLSSALRTGKGGDIVERLVAVISKLANFIEALVEATYSALLPFGDGRMQAGRATQPFLCV